MFLFLQVLSVSNLFSMKASFKYWCKFITLLMCVFINNSENISGCSVIFMLTVANNPCCLLAVDGKQTAVSLAQVWCVSNVSEHFHVRLCLTVRGNETQASSSTVIEIYRSKVKRTASSFWWKHSISTFPSLRKWTVLFKNTQSLLHLGFAESRSFPTFTVQVSELKWWWWFLLFHHSCSSSPPLFLSCPHCVYVCVCVCVCVNLLSLYDL